MAFAMKRRCSTKIKKNNKIKIKVFMFMKKKINNRSVK